MSDDEYALLRASIGASGLRVPLEIDPAGTVLDGHQRLRAALELGLTRVPVVVIDPDDQVEYMVEAAIERRQLSPSQRAALAVELEDYWRASAEAKRRSRANLRHSTERATLPARGRTRELVAKRTGARPRTVQDAAMVKAADEDLFAEVKAGRLPANRAAERVRRARRDQALGQPGPLPEGPFELIYADPPWQLGSADSDRAPENHYPTMALEEIKALPVPAAADAVLFLWTVACRLREAFDVMEAWGFEPKTNIAWVKPRFGLGTWVRHRHELLLVGRKGDFPPPEPENRPDSVIEAPRERHSQKPDRAYELIERAYPRASKVELFARRARPGWAAWGNEAPTGPGGGE